MKVFYHDDMDGCCAASLITQFTGNYNEEDYVPLVYDRPFPFGIVDEGEDLWLVDLSLGEENARVLRETLTERSFNPIWIDNHVTSVKTLLNPEFREWLSGLKGLLCPHSKERPFSAAALTWLYLTKLTGYPADTGSWPRISDRGDDMIGQPLSQLDEDDPDNSLPLYLTYVSHYDCWNFSLDPLTSQFKLGIESHDYRPTSDIWANLYVENQRSDSRITDAVLKRGKVIKTYIDMEHREYFLKHAYLTTVVGLPCLAVNRRVNSWIFGDQYGKYPLHMTYAFNGRVWTFSIFSRDPDVDCSKIAASFGGGGHREAAGFTMKEMPFVANEGS